MIMDWFSRLTLAMEGSFGLAWVAAFIWGILSILLSPCHLSSIPLVIGFINTQGKITLKRTFTLSLMFSIGILITIAGIGVITALMGRMLGDIGRWGNIVVAGVFFVIGLYLLDVIKLEWSSFAPTTTQLRGIPAAVVLGLLFGVGLGPCTFAYMAPVLGVVFQLASTEIIKAILLLFAFGIGHCAVIVLAGTLTKWVQSYLNWSEESTVTIWIKRICGILVIFGGVYLIYTTS
ncbi:MAG: cytochrome C biogenesis protein [Gemmatimonadetes bacterium]|nr:MAG: cytochrome C biogenesis protein [Gemmatimonadota bacterium]